MNARKMITVAMLVLAALAGGCATNRSEIAIASPAAQGAAPTADASAPVVVIRTVTDERVFQQDPPDPSMPSLGFGGAQSATDEVKARAIGRKRNSFGKAMGDILLENGQTVTGLVRDNLSAAFVKAGYRVAAAGETPSGALVADVHVREFWSWFQPGFWAIALHTKIDTRIDLAGGQPVSVQVHAEDSRQMATDGAWMEIVGVALDQYREEAAKRLPPAH